MSRDPKTPAWTNPPGEIIRGLKERGLRTGSLRDAPRRIGVDNRFGDVNEVELNQQTEAGSNSRLPLEPYSFALVNGQWLAKHEPGVVSQLYPQADAPPDSFPVYSNGSLLTADPVPTLLLPSTVSYVYLYFKTDEKRKIQDAGGGVYAEIKAFAAPQNATHPQLLNDSGVGETGEQYILLYVTKLEDDKVVVDESQPFRYGNYDWFAGYNQLENVGSGHKVYSENDKETDVKKLRTLTEGYGTNLLTSSTEIAISAATQSVGDRGEDIIENPGDPGPIGEPIQIRKIDGRAESDDPQIHVRSYDNVGAAGTKRLQVEGNGYNNVTGGIVQDLEVVDGLVKSFGIVGSGGNLNLTVAQKQFTLDGNNVMTYDGETGSAVHYWRNGVYVGTTDPADGLGTDVTVDNWTES